MKNQIKNIAFSTTRQWNPGDEIILQGIRNVLDSLAISYNPIIYNRNPDIRSMHQNYQLFRSSHIPADFWQSYISKFLEANLKFGFFDNSLKPDADGSYLDWVIFAGTPEWCNGRVHDLYSLITRFNIPTMYLGIGGIYEPDHPDFANVLKKSKALLTRSPRTLQSLKVAGFNAQSLPCPSLLAATPAQERSVDKIQRIALTYQAKESESVLWSGFSEESYQQARNLYGKLLETYGKQIPIDLVCHYVDEIPLAMRDFPGLNVRYSFNSEEYLKIYADYDLVIGSRVHGIGMAASLGIPGVALAHDMRIETCEGFLAEILYNLNDLDQCLGQISKVMNEVGSRHRALLAHKRSTFEAYQKIMRTAFVDDTVSYEGKDIQQIPARYNLKGLMLKLPLISARFLSKRIGQDLMKRRRKTS